MNEGDLLKPLALVNQNLEAEAEERQMTRDEQHLADLQHSDGWGVLRARLEKKIAEFNDISELIMYEDRDEMWVNAKAKAIIVTELRAILSLVEETAQAVAEVRDEEASSG